AYFGGGGEIALAPQRVAGDIIAVFGMREAQFHITPDRHRSGRRDQLLDLGLQRRIVGHGLSCCGGPDVLFIIAASPSSRVLAESPAGSGWLAGHRLAPRRFAA